MTTMKKIMILATALLMAAIGCSKSTAPETPPAELTAAEYLGQGWTNFNAGSYSSAQTSFVNAIAKDAALADAYNGKGWCQGILGDPTAALSTFKAGLSHSGTSAILNELRAGQAFSYAALDSSTQAIAKGLEVLADSAWQFSHTYRPSARDNVLNYKEVALLLAQSYFKLGQFPNALSWVQLLNPGFSANVTTTAGQAALQVEIERLAGLM
jgi:tetratricopeptide (TPR) repeat protein